MLLLVCNIIPFLVVVLIDKKQRAARAERVDDNYYRALEDERRIFVSLTAADTGNSKTMFDHVSKNRLAVATVEFRVKSRKCRSYNKYACTLNNTTTDFLFIKKIALALSLIIIYLLLVTTRWRR